MTSKVTRDIIQSEIADFFAGVVEIHTELGGPSTVEEAQNQLTDRVLACVPEVDSEPVAWRWRSGPNAWWQLASRGDIDGEVEPLYRHAQPAPVVQKIMSRLAYLLDEDQFHNIESMVLAAGIHPAGTSQVIPEVMSMENLQYKPLTKSWREGWNACRAAMLQAAPVCTCPSGDGSLRWPCPSHPGNSPVIPDGWIPVSERMPEDAQWCAVITEYGYYVQCWSDGQGWLGDDISIPSVDVTHWMPLPAAPQEVKGE